jgi:hypothetical protein
VHVAHLGIERLTSPIPKRCRARHERPAVALHVRRLVGELQDILKKLTIVNIGNHVIWRIKISMP